LPRRPEQPAARLAGRPDDHETGQIARGLCQEIWNLEGEDYRMVVGLVALACTLCILYYVWQPDVVQRAIDSVWSGTTPTKAVLLLAIAEAAVILMLCLDRSHLSSQLRFAREKAATQTFSKPDQLAGEEKQIHEDLSARPLASVSFLERPSAGTATPTPAPNPVASSNTSDVADAAGPQAAPGASRSQSRGVLLKPTRSLRASTVPAKSSDTLMAWVWAQELIESQHLKAPKTAEWPTDGWLSGRSYDEFVTYKGGGEYDIKAWVDAENLFGAKVRTHFRATVEDLGDGTWILTSFRVQ